MFKNIIDNLTFSQFEVSMNLEGVRIGEAGASSDALDCVRAILVVNHRLILKLSKYFA
jgi:hypothetical protein